MLEDFDRSETITITDPKTRLPISFDCEMDKQGRAIVVSAFVGHGEGITGEREAQMMERVEAIGPNADPAKREAAKNLLTTYIFPMIEKFTTTAPLTRLNKDIVFFSERAFCHFKSQTTDSMDIIFNKVEQAMKAARNLADMEARKPTSHVQRATQSPMSAFCDELSVLLKEELNTLLKDKDIADKAGPALEAARLALEAKIPTLAQKHLGTGTGKPKG